MTSQEFKNKVKHLSINKKCFFFMVDFEKKKPLVLTNEEINTSKILFKVGEYSNFQNPKNKKNKKITINKIPIKKSKYLKSFTKVQDHINRGDTYLLNLTFPSKITLNDTLENILVGFPNDIDLLKIDTEGNEFNVLKGAKKLFEFNKIKAIHFEFNQMNIVSKSSFKDFWDLLNENFIFYRILPRGRLLPIVE